MDTYTVIKKVVGVFVRFRAPLLSLQSFDSTGTSRWRRTDDLVRGV
jgi:hypothetical protein